MTEASIRSRLILLGGITLLLLTVLFGVDRGLKAYYYSQTYRYYEAGEVYYEDEKTLLLYSPHRTLFWLLKPHITMRIEEAPDQYDAYTIGSRPGHYSFEIRSNADGLTVGLSQQVLETNPQTNPVRRRLAVALQHEGRFQEAHEEFLGLNEGILFSQYENVVRWVSEEAKVRLSWT